MSNDSVCARCTKRFGRSCCEPGEGENLATLTWADVARISDASGRGAASFLEEEWLTHEEAWTYERVRLLFRGYFAQGPRRLTLRRSSSGACVFHQAGRGCSLGEDVRPLACRLYPFEKLADGSWGLAIGRSAEGDRSGCLAVDEAEELHQLEARFGVTGTLLDSWAEQLSAEAVAHGRRTTSIRGR